MLLNIQGQGGGITEKVSKRGGARMGSENARIKTYKNKNVRS